MSDWTEVKCTRQGNLSGTTLRITVLRESGVEKKWWDAAYNGITQAAEEVYSNTNINGYEIRKWKTSHDLPNNGSDAITAAQDWLDSHILANGTYLWIHDEGDYPRAAWATGAWEDAVAAIASGGYYGKGTNYHSVMAIHEAFHPLLNNTHCDEVSNLTNGQTDHALGKDIDVSYYGTSWNATPMVASYEDGSENYETKGDCSNDETTVGVTRNLSQCTVDALEYSWEHSVLNGSHR